MTWNSILSVGIETVDSQHKKLFEYINNLYDALIAKKEVNILNNIFDSLEDYIKTHFSYEENLFHKFNYEKTTEHIEQHKFFKEFFIIFLWFH